MKFTVLALFAMVFLLSGCDNGNGDDHVERTPAPPFFDVEEPRELEYFEFTHTNMPRTAGSPALAPLAEAVASVVLGEPREDVREPVPFTRTTQAFRNLAAGDADILFVSEPSPSVLAELRHVGWGGNQDIEVQLTLVK